MPEASIEIRAWASATRSTTEAAPVTVTSSSSTTGSPTSRPLGTGPITARTGTTRLIDGVELDDDPARLEVEDLDPAGRWTRP